MKIGIDARLIGETGVGRYIRNLIRELAAADRRHTYTVFLTKKGASAFTVPNRRWKKAIADVRWHTVAEQLEMPRICSAAGVDLLHVPYHNPPILYGGPMVITMHDLTILHFSTGKATTLPLPLYALKRIGYRTELAVGLRKARHIIAVSEATKAEIMSHFGIRGDRISVTYEGVDTDMLAHLKSGNIRNPGISSPYFLYAGNAYPHKNLERLLAAFRLYIHSRPGSDDMLVLVGAGDYFYTRLAAIAGEAGLRNRVRFYGPADDAALVSLYRHARAFVFPSLMEGFGLPSLEALAAGCPVIASDIPVFHEILKDAVTYVNPYDVSSIAEAFTRIPDTRVKLADSFFAPYSWKKLARKTLAVYEDCARL